MKDVYVQSGGVGLVHDLEGELSSVYGGVGLVHDLEGELSSVYGPCSYFAVTAFFSSVWIILQFTSESIDFFEMFKWNN